MKLLLAVALLATSGAAFAGDKSDRPQAEKKICKREAITESRMGAKMICQTAAQWKQDGMSDADIAHMQSGGKVH